MHRAGHSKSEISKALKYHYKTVSRIIDRLEVTGGANRKPHKHRSDRIRTPRFVAGLKRSIKSKPDNSIVQLAKNRAGLSPGP